MLICDYTCPPQSAADVDPCSEMRDGDVGELSNNFSLHVRCMYTSHDRPDERSGRVYDPIFSRVSSSAMLIEDDG